MTAWGPTIAAFLMMMLAGGAGMLLAKRLPPEWLGEGSVKNLKTGMAIVATMSSLLLGLMVNSSRFNFSEAYSDVQKYSAALQITDLELLNFGAPACPVRLTLQQYARQLVAENWDQDVDLASSSESALRALLRFDGEVRALQPANADQTAIRNNLLSLSRQLVEYRWKVTGVARTATPITFIGVVISWFALIFAYTGVFAPRNPLVVGGQLLAMAAISAAIFLVTEMGEPFVGPIQVSSGPVVRLVARMEVQPCPLVKPPG